MNDNVKKAIFTPAQTAQIGSKFVDHAIASKDRAIPIMIEGLQDYFAEVMPGEIVAIQAQTHNYKTGFLNSWESYIAGLLSERDDPTEIIVHVDAETVIEHLAAREMAKVIKIPVGDISRGRVPDTEIVKTAVTKISGVPIYRIGATLGRDSVRFNDLHLSNVFRAIEYIKSNDPDPKKRLHDEPRKIAAMFFDYLQAFPYDPEVRRQAFEAQRRLQVRSDVYRIRSMSAILEAPSFVALQAKQVLEGAPSKDFYIPGIYDGKESSDIGERFDRVVSLWMPKVTHMVGDTLEYKGVQFDVREDGLWVKFNKQRGGLPSGKSFYCKIDFTSNIITVDMGAVRRTT